MKKIFKKAVACLIAVLMIVSSLPFTAITAQAATSSASVLHYGVLKGSDTTRMTGSILKICNNQYNSNFTIGFVTFNVSNLSLKQTDGVTASYKFNLKRASGCKDSAVDNMTVFYPTSNIGDFNVSSNTDTNKNGNTVFSGDDGKHLDRAKSYYGLQSLKTFKYSSITDSSSGTDETVDIGPALKAAKVAGSSYATICFILSQGSNNGSSGWSDTEVNAATTSTVSVTTTQGSLSDYKNFISSKINGSAPTYSTTTATSGSSLSNHGNYMKNILVSGSYGVRSDDVINNFSDSTSTKNTFRVDGIDTLVAVYDSQNADIRIPVIVESTDGGTKTGVSGYVGIDHVALRNGGQFSLANSTWARTNSYTDFGDNSDNSHDFSSNINNNVNRSEGSDSQRFAIKDGKQWKNYIKFTADSSFDTNYYATMTNLAYNYQADYTWSWWSFGTKWGNYSDYSRDTNASVKYAVINYLPLKNLLNSSELKANFNTISANESLYVESDLLNYYSALADLYDFNLVSGLTYDTVSSKASEMKTLISNYEKYKNPAKKTFTLKFTTVEGVVTNKTVTAGEQIGELPANTTPKHLVNTDTHSTYSWSVNSTDVPTANAEYTETSTTSACSGGTATCTQKAVCTVCDGEYGELVAHQYNDENVCTVCGNFNADTQAYDYAVEQSNSFKNDEQYTPDSRQRYADTVQDAINKRSDAKKQSDIDALTAQIISAQALLRKTSITITVKKVVGDEESDVTTITKEYGTSEDIDIVALTNSEVKGVEKWTITTDDGKTITKLNTLDTSVTLYVTKDVTITAYASDEASDSTSSKVVFLGLNGRVAEVRYLPSNETLETNKVTAPSVPFYTFTKWSTDIVTGNGETIYVRAEYTCKVSSDWCVVHFVDASKNIVSSKKYDYDSYARIPDDINGTYFALASDKDGNNILTYLDGRDFYVPYVKDIYAVVVENREPKIAITGSYSNPYNNDGTAMTYATFNCKFYLPDDCTLVEWGAEISASGRTQVVKGEKISKNNEYSITMNINASTSITAFDGVAYVTYKDSDGAFHTIKSASVTQTLTKA